jgi:hypothetical protein
MQTGITPTILTRARISEVEVLHDLAVTQVASAFHVIGVQALQEWRLTVCVLWYPLQTHFRDCHSQDAIQALQETRCEPFSLDTE